MDESIEAMLDEQIRYEIMCLEPLESGTEEKSRAIDDLAKLYRLRLDENSKKDEVVDAKKDKLIRISIAGAELIVPLIFYGVWMKKGFKFEETGTYTSTTFRGLISRFKPTKK